VGITSGGVLAGIVGALLAVPAIAFADRAIRALLAPDAAAEAAAETEESGPRIEAEPDNVEAEPEASQ
jgi:NAD(P)H-hydrate repair Nnr-like enzyme with NAD(P)H-hydrate dehydratase domain